MNDARIMRRVSKKTPDASDIARIISALSVSGFQKCFVSWMEDAVRLSDGEIIALDGKTH